MTKVDDLKIGDFVTVTWDSMLDKLPTLLQMQSDFNGEPFEILNLKGLPFVLVRKPNADKQTIDIRRYSVQKVDQSYFEQYIETYYFTTNGKKLVRPSRGRKRKAKTYISNTIFCPCCGEETAMMRKENKVLLRCRCCDFSGGFILSEG